MDESTLYTMQYIISSRVEKLFNFAVSEQVLSQLQAILKSYMERYVGHKFKSLEMLELGI